MIERIEAKYAEIDIRAGASTAVKALATVPAYAPGWLLGKTVAALRIVIAAFMAGYEQGRGANR